MVRESFTMGVARSRVAAYDTIIQDHVEAMDCFDCDALLQFGIEAFEWICKADDSVHAVLYQEPARPEIAGALKEIEALYRQWLLGCEPAEGWIAKVTRNGFDLEHLARFRECCAEALAIVEQFDESPVQEMSAALGDLMDSAIQEHRNGETAEFI